MKNDILIRALSKQGGISAWVADTTQLVETARGYHNTAPVATAALGRTLTMTAFLAQNLKSQTARLSITIKGDGPLGAIVTAADGMGHLKGYVDNPNVVLPPNARHKLDVAGAVGKGQLTVVRDMGLKEPYVGRVELQSGEVAEDFAYYLTVSEQTPSAVSLGVMVAPEGEVLAAGGVLLQTLPGVTEEELQLVEATLADLDGVSGLIFEGMSPADILKNPLGALEFEIIEQSKLEFLCDCSRKRLEEVLLSMGAEELKELIEEGSVSLHCHFCEKVYDFTQQDLRDLLKTGMGE